MASRCLLASVVLLLAATAQGEPLEVASPDGRIVVTFTLVEGAPHYAVTRDDEPLVLSSPMGFRLQNEVSLAERFELIESDTASVDTTWTTTWGESREVRDHHNELRVRLRQSEETGRELTVVFRVFDDGVALRYAIPKQPHLDRVVILDEVTEFRLAGDWPAWWIPAFQNDRYEYIYSKTPISETDTVHTPVTLQASDRCFVSLHEAAIVDFSSMGLERTAEHTLKARLYPWSDGVLVRGQAPMVSPWRTIQVGDTPSALVESSMHLNLNEPSKIVDTSWIEPGKYVGVWWEMHINNATWGSGERHGATTANVKRFMDFAGKHGFDGVLVEGWNRGWDGDWMGNGHEFSFTEPYPDFDIEELSRYGAERGVYLVGHHETAGAIPNYESQLEAAFAFYERLGVKAVKTGYVDYGSNLDRIDDDGRTVGEWSHGQYMVRHHQRVIEEAAKHRIMIVAHEAIKDTGLRRTWPNFLSRECARGQEYNAWSGDWRNPPSHTTILPYTRMLSGPMDFTPGAFDIKLERGNQPGNQIPTTLAKQLALYVVIYSPMQMACDLPEAYEAHPDAFRFIVDVPVDWERTRALSGVIGEHCVIARQERGGDDWYLGAITNEEARTLSVPLDFLDEDARYLAQIYADAEDADWRENPTAYAIEEREVASDTVLELRLAPGGGTAIRFKAM